MQDPVFKKIKKSLPNGGIPLSECIVIDGGTRLDGEVSIGGAKNAVLKQMAACILISDTCKLYNVPDLTDVDTMIKVLNCLGVKIEYDKVHKSLEIDASNITGVIAPYELVSKMRASFIVLGALLSRCQEAKVAMPGGCAIGERRIDYHIKGFEALGAKVKIENGYVIAKASKLAGADIYLDKPSVGATENIILASVFAEGSTRIQNAAQEPEIADLANFLNLAGADISGAGTSEIVINGVPKGSLKPISYTTMPDRIEAGTYMASVVATRGHAIIRNVFPNHLTFVTNKLIEIGAEVNILEPLTMEVSCSRRPKATNIVTQPYPGFPTDMQSPFSSILAIADGTSIVTENLYENRFMQIGELARMGADIHHDGNHAIIKGVEKLTGTEVKASDLRAGGALIVAGLSAYGRTVIQNIHHIDRGYENLVDKLTSLGGHAKRVDNYKVEEPLLIK